MIWHDDVLLIDVSNKVRKRVNNNTRRELSWRIMFANVRRTSMDNIRLLGPGRYHDRRLAH